MADTKRTRTELATLLADNTSGDISPQDVRDFLESLDVGRGACYWSAFATTTIPSTGTAVAGGTNRVKVVGTTVSKTLNRFTHASPGELKYTGTPTIRVDVFAQFCFSLDASAQHLAFELYKNGVFLAGSYTLQRYFTANTPAQVVLLGEDDFALDDKVEIYVANTTSAGTILTPIAGYINVQEIPLG